MFSNKKNKPTISDYELDESYFEVNRVRVKKVRVAAKKGFFYIHLH